MRSVEFIGTARLVTIYGRKYDVIFKRVENKFIRAEFTRNTTKPVTEINTEV